MDFVIVLSWSPKDNYVIWVIMDHLIKIAHFILFHMGQSIEALVEKVHA